MGETIINVNLPHMRQKIEIDKETKVFENRLECFHLEPVTKGKLEYVHFVFCGKGSTECPCEKGSTECPYEEYEKLSSL